MAKIIMGIHVNNRDHLIPDVQPLLTEYGCYIKTRIGLHDASDDRRVCSENGLLILEFIQDAEEEAEELRRRLDEIGGVNVQSMSF